MTNSTRADSIRAAAPAAVIGAAKTPGSGRDRPGAAPQSRHVGPALGPASNPSH